MFRNVMPRNEIVTEEAHSAQRAAAPPYAPMVTKTTYAVIGDPREVVPAIGAEIRPRRGQSA